MFSSDYVRRKFLSPLWLTARAILNWFKISFFSRLYVCLLYFLLTNKVYKLFNGLIITVDNDFNCKTLLHFNYSSSCNCLNNSILFFSNSSSLSSPSSKLSSDAFSLSRFFSCGDRESLARLGEDDGDPTDLLAGDGDSDGEAFLFLDFLV